MGGRGAPAAEVIMTIRMPAVAGRFYPGSRQALQTEISRYVPAGVEPRAVKGLLAPHAGYMYSGPVAGAVYAAAVIPERVVVLCPNHTGHGRPLAMMGDGLWHTPLGDVPVDNELAADLSARLPQLESDESAHRFEHSLEVQLPFLQCRRPDFSLVPICIGTSRPDLLLRLGEALAGVVADQPGPVLLVASSDMTHYEPAAEASRKDHLAIRCLEALDPEGLARTVQEEDISMCGWAPAMAVVQACKRLGATRGELVRYATSGDVTGDTVSVVGYAGMLFY
jgi:AmmeMemoRadiSam system protein B